MILILKAVSCNLADNFIVDFIFQEGINPQNFAEIMIVSGLVLMPPVRWLSFSSGYDFGYLLNLLTNQDLPKTENEFFDILKIYFPCVYDVKYLMKSCKNLKGGLQEVANELDVPRIGPQHQAGSDSLLTGQTFFKMKEMFFEGRFFIISEHVLRLILLILIFVKINIIVTPICYFR